MQAEGKWGEATFGCICRILFIRRANAPRECLATVLALTRCLSPAYGPKASSVAPVVARFGCPEAGLPELAWRRPSLQNPSGSQLRHRQRLRYSGRSKRLFLKLS